MATAPPSDSSAQRAAERFIRNALCDELQVGDLEKRSIALKGGAHCEVDAASADLSVLVEISARIGPPSDGQRKKIARDALKLITLRLRRPKATLMIAFCDHGAADYYLRDNWLASALKMHGIKVRVVDVPDDVRESLREAQRFQNMGNAPLGMPAADEWVAEGA